MPTFDAKSLVEETDALADLTQALTLRKAGFKARVNAAKSALRAEMSETRAAATRLRRRAHDRAVKLSPV